MSEPVAKSTRANVLIVEDSSVFREMQSLLLRQAGYAISAHEHPHAALEAAKARSYDLVVIDYELPAMNGEEFMHALRKIRPEIAIVFVSGSLNLELAIKLTSQGVAGIFHKPVNPKILLEKINETLARASAGNRGSNSPLPAARRSNSNSPLGAAPAVPATEPADADLAYAPRHFVGRSEAFRDFTHRLWRVRDFRAVLLLQGEAGSPFELIARDLVDISIFRDGPVMLCDAAKFEPRHLIEVLAPALLSADAGTLIVTGIEQLDTAQQKILETLMTGRDVFLPFARRFRLVLAAASNISELADEGRFNETLYYKISSISLAVPALRDLTDDIVPNAEHLLAEHRITLNLSAPLALTPAAAAWLKDQTWAGNHEQLSQTLLAAAKSNRNGAIDVPALETAFGPLGTKAASPVSVPVVATAVPVEAARVAAPSKPIVAPVAAVAPVATAAPFAPAMTARSAFRPASPNYDFAQRLAASLAAAEAVT